MTLHISLFQTVSLFLGPIILLSFIIFILVLFVKNKEYKESAYYQVTKNSYFSVHHNIGQYGEYLTYKYLKHMEEYGAKFLFNVYIPKGNGETTEIDVLMICSKGIFVFESKNYSGWIFGSERQKNWYQTLPAGRGRSHKEQFYNPIMQNRSHIKHLKTLLDAPIPLQSIIVFSDRCTLKSVHVESNNIFVINRYDIASVVSMIYKHNPMDVLNERQILQIYNKLYPFTQVDEFTKAQHIENIHDNLENDFICTGTSPVYPEAEFEEFDESIFFTSKNVEPTHNNIVNEEKSSTSTIESLSIKSEPPTAKNLKCPWCNRNLILRTATRGANVGKQFYGCSNYPKCKYIQKL